jgi:hypothetical protein
MGDFMFVAVKDNNVDELRVIARQCDQIAGKTVFPKLAGVVNFPEDIAGAFKCYLMEMNVRVMWLDLPPTIHALHFTSDNKHHIIAISDTMRGKGEEWKGLRDVKSHVLHELAHIVRDHPAAYVPPTKGDHDELLRLSMLYNNIMNPATASYRQFENEAEVFAAALGFWPGNVFMKQFAGAKGEFRRVANFFKMPVDCAIKWALLSRPELDIHYFKYNVDTNATEDYHIPAHYTPAQFPWDFLTGCIVEDLKTAAGLCKRERDDRNTLSKAHLPDLSEYWCYSYYERASFSKTRSHDKIVVGGFPKSLYDLLNS